MTIKKILTCIFLMFVVSSYAQTYPKYTGTKSKTASARQETVTQAPTAEERVTEKEPVADFNALIKQAQQEYLGQQYDKAGKTYAEALAVCPDEFKHIVYTKRAWSYYAVKNFDKCIEDCTTAIEKTKVPDEITIGRIYLLRSLAYKSRNGAGDMERACADHHKAKETGALKGSDLNGYDCDKK